MSIYMKRDFISDFSISSRL